MYLFQMDELDELLSLRDVRTPVRLRFGRRSDEHAVPHIFPQEVYITINTLLDGKLNTFRLADKFPNGVFNHEPTYLWRLVPVLSSSTFLCCTIHALHFGLSSIHLPMAKNLS